MAKGCPRNDQKVSGPHSSRVGGTWVADILREQLLLFLLPAQGSGLRSPVSDALQETDESPTCLELTEPWRRKGGLRVLP